MPGLTWSAAQVRSCSGALPRAPEGFLSPPLHCRRSAIRPAPPPASGPHLQHPSPTKQPLTTNPNSPTKNQSAEYANPSYLGVELPFSIYQLAWANSLLMGGVELLRNTELDPEKRCYPGGRRA